jgi:hypothetical protein
MRGHFPIWRSAGAALLCALIPVWPALAEEAPESRATVPPVTQQEVSATQRLGNWLAAHPEMAVLDDPRVLHWQVARQRSPQAATNQALAARLAARHSALAAMVRNSPATGRVPLPSTDGRLLEVAFAQDPWLSPGDQLVRYPVNDQVTVLQPDGYLCTLRHQAGAVWTRYLSACGLPTPAWGWVIQPDGQIRHAAAESRYSEPVSPSPGAWLWAPASAEGFSEQDAQAVAAFLATQPPASQLNYAWQRAGTPLPVVEPGTATWDRPLPHVSTTDWGAIGLLQTPTARMEPAGSGGFMIGRAIPYSHIKARLQPFDWVSLSFGYLSLSDRRYGDESWAGKQSYKDKSLDIKLRLRQEDSFWPEVAVGWRDLLGTGLFSSEYFVASKAFGPVDFSAGLAFGYLGSRGDVHNPFSWISPKFNERPAPNTATGQFNSKSYFRGPAALFAGLSYQLPNPDWQLKLEYDGNDYHVQTGNTQLRQDSPFNIGLVYRLSRSVDLTVGYERGNQVMFGLMLQTQLDRLGTPKILDPKPVPVRPDAPERSAPAEATVKTLEEQINAPVLAMRTTGPRWSLVLDHADRGFQRPLIDKVTAVAHRDAPPEIKTFDITLQNQGLDVATAHVDRDTWVKQHTEYVIPAEQRDPVTVTSVAPSNPTAETATPTQSRYDRDQAGKASPWNAGTSLGYAQTIGGPNGFILFDLSGDLDVDYHFNAGTWLTSRTRVRLIDNYGKFKYTAPSNMPRVRTYIREYLTTSRVTLPVLQLTRTAQWGDNHFFMAYAGALETMFAGAGGEYLYRPVHSTVAFGVDVNRVYQRTFEQRLSLRDYRVTTGHATVYWDTGYEDVLLKLSAGRYLAGDVGATVDASRVFANGVKFGAYATKTNVSAQEFGEGSFDKGIYITIPFDVMLPRTGGGDAYIAYAPLLRDGGAKLNRRYTLFDLTRSRDPRALSEAEPIE